MQGRAIATCQNKCIFFAPEHFVHPSTQQKLLTFPPHKSFFQSTPLEPPCLFPISVTSERHTRAHTLNAGRRVGLRGRGRMAARGGGRRAEPACRLCLSCPFPALAGPEPHGRALGDEQAAVSNPSCEPATAPGRAGRRGPSSRLGTEGLRLCSPRDGSEASPATTACITL